MIAPLSPMASSGGRESVDFFGARSKLLLSRIFERIVPPLLNEEIDTIIKIDFINPSLSLGRYRGYRIEILLISAIEL